MRKYIILFAVCMIIISGCSIVGPMIPSESPPSTESDSQLLQKAESLRGAFFYRGECDEQCQKVIEAYKEAVELSKDPEVRAQAQQKLAEFLFWLKDFDEALVYARQLAASRDAKYRCQGYHLMGNIMRQMKRYNDALGYFYNALETCESKDNAERSICYTYADLGRKEDADDFCTPYYS